MNTTYSFRFEYTLGLFFLVSVLVLMMPWIHGNDGAGYYAPVRSWVVDGDLNLQNEYEHFIQDRPLAAIRIDPATGKYYSQYPVGVSLIWLPAVSAAHGISHLFSYPTTGYTKLYYWLVCFWSACLAFGAIVLLFRFFTNWYSRRIVFWSVITGWLATNLFYYMIFEASLSHAVSFGCTTLFFLQAHKLYYQSDYRVVWEWSKMGLLAGLVFIIRYQDGIVWFIPAVIGIAKYVSAFRQKDRSAAIHLLFAHLITILIAGLVILPDLLVNVWQHGKIWVSGSQYYHGSFKMDQWWYGLKVLIDPNHGLLFWTPVVGLAFLGLALNPKKAERNVLLVTVVIHIMVTGFWHFWHGAQSYSHRFFVGYIPLFMYGLVILQNRLTTVRVKRIRVLFLILIVWNFALMAQYGLRLIPAEGPLDIKLFIENFNQLFEILSGVFDYIRSKVVPE